MPTELQDALAQAVMITAFVAVMMVAVEYLNVLTRGTLEGALRGAPVVQCLAAVVLGATRGCLGAFTVVALYGHRVAVRHVPRIFAWTAAVLAGVTLLSTVADLQAVIRQSPWALLGLAGLPGLIPESGPHLVFVTLYATGGIPAGVLAARSIVQDGHGMLPLLAQSRGDFVRVKAINLVVGLLVGALLLAAGL